MVDIQNYSGKLASAYTHSPDCIYYDRTTPASYSQRRGEKGGSHAYFQPQCRCLRCRFIQPLEYLMYHGTSDWDVFHLKYKRFVREQDMSVENAMQFLSCVLTGMAAKCHASTTCHSPSCSLRDILDIIGLRAVLGSYLRDPTEPPRDEIYHHTYHSPDPPREDHLSGDSYYSQEPLRFDHEKTKQLSSETMKETSDQEPSNTKVEHEQYYQALETEREWTDLVSSSANSQDSVVVSQDDLRSLLVKSSKKLDYRHENVDNTFRRKPN
ncbi:hypothetical protein ElyMa_003297000 [Elysia marginata]|uniref:Uncharacterized protein n=1 Tax=Elysia marginata TaxID=1093978 RepID=A0AAV4JAE0_9GAST|nr:hypothetical protein ElyMa_003297000 [Elysia marginata]